MLTQFAREWLHHLIYPQVLPAYRRENEDAQRSLLEWGKHKSEQWLSVHDRMIEGQRFLCGDSLTLADYFAAEIVWSGTLIDVRYDHHANVDRWMTTMRALPSWHKVNEAVDALAATLRGKPFVTIT